MNEYQFTLLISNFLITKMIFAFPRFLFRTSGNAAWFQAIYISVAALVIFAISVQFYAHTGKKSILQLAESIGGKPLRILVSLLVMAIIIANIGTEMRIFAESVKIILLPKTKTEYIMILFALTVTIGALCGFGSLVTVNALFFPLCLFCLAAMFVVLIPSYNINNIFPIFGTGIKNIFADGLGELSAFSDLIVLNLLLPHAKDIKTAKKSGVKAIIIAGITLTAICLSYGLIYPYPYSSEFLLIPYQLSRMVRAGEYFQRFEALFEFVWSLTQLLYASIYVFVLGDVFGSAFKLKSSRPIIPAIVAILVLISFEPVSVADLLDTSYALKKLLTPAAYLLPILIPLLYMAVRRRRYDK